MLLFFSAVYLFFNKPTKKIYFTDASNSDRDIKPDNTKDRSIFFIALCVFLIGLIISQLGTTYPIYVEEKFPSLGVQGVSFLFTLDTLLIVLLQMPLVNFFKKFNKMLIISLGTFLMAISMILLIMASHFWIAIISCIIWAFGEMLFVAISQLICYERSAINKKGLGLGIYQAAFAASLCMGPTMGGFIYHSYGAYSLWSLCAVIAICCTVGCIPFRDNVISHLFCASSRGRDIEDVLHEQGHNIFNKNNM